MAEYSLANLDDFIGQELGISSWLVIDQERVNQFAACTGDHQWIHVDLEEPHGKAHWVPQLSMAI